MRARPGRSTCSPARTPGSSSPKSSCRTRMFARSCRPLSAPRLQGAPNTTIAGSPRIRMAAGARQLPPRHDRSGELRALSRGALARSPGDRLRGRAYQLRRADAPRAAAQPVRQDPEARARRDREGDAARGRHNLRVARDGAMTEVSGCRGAPAAASILTYNLAFHIIALRTFGIAQF